jgi:osmotically-inducible protein OsmY
MSIEMWLADRDDAGVGSEIQSQVFGEFARDPALNGANVLVDVRDRVVMLSGTVRSYPQKLAAGRAARRVRGVRKVHNQVAVELQPAHQRTDEELVQAVTCVSGTDVLVPHGKVVVGIASGWLTLTGVVDHYAERQAAEEAVLRLVGVKGVTNLIRVEPTYSPTDPKARVIEALQRRKLLRRDRIKVEVRGGAAMLRGRVRTLAERDEAVAAAAGTPGVARVRDDLRIAS